MYIIMMEEIVAEDFVYELFETAMKETIFAVPCPADCRTGRALVGKLYLADKRGIDFDFLSAELPPAFPVKGFRFVDNDFLHKLPQQGRGEFLKAGVLAYHFHKLFSVRRGFQCP